MNSINLLNLDFRSSLTKKWFNDNYFIGLYNLDDTLITVFEDVEALTKFLNKPLKLVIYRLKNNDYIEYNNHKVKMYIFKKDKEDDLDFGGKSLWKKKILF